MAKIKVIGGRQPQTINPNLIENDFANTSNLFNIGDFKISTNREVRIITDSNDLSLFSQPITLDTLNITDITESKQINTTTEKLVLNFDKSNLNNYAMFGSLEERLKSAINTIIEKWVGSLYISNLDQTDGSIYNTVTSYSYDELQGVSTFQVPTFTIINKFNLSYFKTSLLTESDDKIKNLISSYSKYVLDVNGITYPLNSITGASSNNTGYLTISVNGNPFSSSTESISYHIRPSDKEFNIFHSNLNNLEKFILSTDTNPLYTFTVKVPVEDESGRIIFKTDSFKWSTTDGYNIDVDTRSFNDYFTSIINLGKIYDNFKSDIVYRMWMPPSLKSTDLTDSLKSRIYSRILGREMDEILLFINGLSNINRISYDKIDNTPDILVKNLANTLGWETFNVIEEEDLFASIFNVKTNDTPVSKTPSELDIELWRRIILNTHYLFKSKGTRKAIEAIFSFIGAPDCFIELNEYIYIVDGKIDPTTVDLSTISPFGERFTQLPFDNEGYPISPTELDDFFFQISGNTDSGQAYLDIYRNLGYTITKTKDNKKSWVYSETGGTRSYEFNGTNNFNYDFEDSRLIINTKEIDITLTPYKAIECDVYEFNKENNYPISSTGRTYPYPVRNTSNYNVNTLSFSQYASNAFERFVNAQNRKVTDGGSTGIHYPSLYKLYEDYLKNSYSDIGVASNKITVKSILDYIKNFQSLFSKFFNQLIPATTIYTGQGSVVRNTIFTPQKFVYKHGINDGSEFQITQPENVKDDIQINKIQGTIDTPKEATIRIFESDGFYNFSSGIEIGSETSTILILKQKIKPKTKKFESELFSFDIPFFTMSGATKITTGVTNTNIFYYTDEETHDLYFDFTANTASLTANTYNALFNFSIYPYNTNTQEFEQSSIFNKTVPYSNFSGGSNTYTETIERDDVSVDTEYLIKPYYTYTFNTPTANTINFLSPYDYYENYNANIYLNNSFNYNYVFNHNLYSSFTGTNFTTQVDLSTLDESYGIYQSSMDYYFLVLSNPPTPLLLTTSGETVLENGNLINENLPINIDYEFVLTYLPIGDIIVSINGSTLQNGLEFSVKTGLSDTFQGRVFQFSSSVIDSINFLTDTVTVSYLAIGNASEIGNTSEYINYTIPSGTTETPPYKLLYNTSTTNFEYFLDNDVTGDENNLIVTVNGNTLTTGTDYQLSISDKNKVIFPDIIFQTGDTINSYYLIATATTTEAIYNITTNPFDFQWEIPQSVNDYDGLYTLRITTENDVNFTGTTVSATTPYISGETLFSLEADFTLSPFSALTSGETYRFRIESDRFYTGITQDIHTTSSYSESALVKIPLS